MLDPAEFGKAMAAIVREATAPLLKRIEELEARQGEKGEKGDPGEPGKDAEPVLVADVVAELVKTEALAPIVDLYATEAVAKHFEANPVQHGRDGKDGERGPPGEGQKGDPGKDGADGIGLAGALIDRNGDLVVTLTNGEQKSLGQVVGKDGDKGQDGADFTDAEIDWDGGRTLVIRSKGGEIRKTLAVPIDKGYWREGMACEKADIVTYDGNAWAALRDTKAKPCHENKEDWRLFARKGRDGRDGKDYKPEPGPIKLGVRDGD